MRELPKNAPQKLNFREMRQGMIALGRHCCQWDDRWIQWLGLESDYHCSFSSTRNAEDVVAGEAASSDHHQKISRVTRKRPREPKSTDDNLASANFTDRIAAWENIVECSFRTNNVKLGYVIVDEFHNFETEGDYQMQEEMRLSGR
ncbi:unnamed protein product [Saccharomyces cerevisiae]|nr:unnamed protein product [Saccharomyces cerevisiae]